MTARQIRPDARPTLHETPQDALSRAQLALMSDRPVAPGRTLPACQGHCWLNDGKGEPGHEPGDTCLSTLYRRAHRVADYRHAKRWRANEVTIGPTGYRKRAMFEMLAHASLCVFRGRCDCPPGYARWWHDLPFDTNPKAPR